MIDPKIGSTGIAEYTLLAHFFAGLVLPKLSKSPRTRQDAPGQATFGRLHVLQLLAQHYEKTRITPSWSLRRV